MSHTVSVKFWLCPQIIRARRAAEAGTLEAGIGDPEAGTEDLEAGTGAHDREVDHAQGTEDVDVPEAGKEGHGGVDREREGPEAGVGLEREGEGAVAPDHRAMTAVEWTRRRRMFNHPPS